jgi:putative oxidoreductase
MSDKIDRRRLIIPALGEIYEAGAPYSYAFMRFATGAVLFPHGYQKVFYSSPDKLAVAIGNKGLPLALTLAYLTLSANSSPLHAWRSACSRALLPR